MRHRLRRLWFACLCLAAAPAARARPVEWLPEASLRLMAQRYTSSEPQFKWSGWIGGGLGLARVHGATLRVDTDVETIIGDERRTFDANQANYHLEASLRRAFGPADVQLVYHHVSRHLEDRPKSQAVDWNALSVRASRRFGGAWPLRAHVGLGHATQVSLVGYGWELVAGLASERALGPSPASARVYGQVDLRRVQAESTPAFPRDSFLDARLEGGLRLRREARQAALFVAFERRNDVFLLQPGARSRVILGLRLGLGE